MRNVKSEILKSKFALIYKDLINALDRLKEATAKPPTVFNQDATIKRFEFVFELSWKLMKAICELEGLKTASPKRAIRHAADLELFDNPKKWFDFLQARNLTVHTYKEKVAQKVYKKAKEFVPYVEELINNTKQYL